MSKEKALELIGSEIGFLKVIDYVETVENGHHLLLCQCKCGRNKKILYGNLVRKNPQQSCGDKNCEFYYFTVSQKQKEKNSYDLTGEYGIGYTSKGDEFYFDLEDYDKMKDYCWYKTKEGYFRTNTFNFESHTRGYLFLHNVIMDIAPNRSTVPDHIGGKNTVHDNRKCNLRISEDGQNNINQKIRIDNTSGTKGVHYDKTFGKWVARISIGGKRIHLGRFSSLEEAVTVRKKAEEKYFGEWSYANSLNTAKERGVMINV